MGRKRKRDFKDEYDATEYLVKDNLRCVVPYIHEYTTYAKGRWLGKGISEVLVKEFGGHPEAYWVNAITMGHVRINNKIIKPTYKMKNNDLLLHRTHRHEPPVVGSVTLVGETNDLLAVCKPPSIPMHPCGAYRYNSLMLILTKNPLVANQPQLHLVHRLDRVTSGLVVLAKSKAVAGIVSKEIRNKITKKFYLARVKGRFPPILPLEHITQRTLDDLLRFPEGEEDDRADGEDCEDTVVVAGSGGAAAVGANAAGGDSGGGIPMVDDTETATVTTTTNAVINESLHHSSNVGYHTDPSTGDLTLSCPIGVHSYRDGIYKCDAHGKVSVTVFSVLGYNAEDDTSVVECRPLTGRTHQIRLHLQLLGTPIANDPCYGGELFYGDNERREKAMAVLNEMRRAGHHPLSKVPHLPGLETSTTTTDVASDTDTTTTTVESEALSLSVSSSVEMNADKLTISPAIVPEVRIENETDDEYLVRTCRYCREPDSAQLEQLLHCDGIWLHALRYKGSGWEFEAPRPAWALIEEIHASY
eukprot:gene3530-7023_t